MTEKLEIIKCPNGVGEWEIAPTGETFDTRREAEERLREMLGDPRPPMQTYEVTATIVVTVEAEDYEQAEAEAIDHFCWTNADIVVEEK